MGISPRRPPAISVRGLSHTYGTGSARAAALSDIDLTVAPGEFVTLVGASGCGKSTLLTFLAGLASPTRGTVELNGARTALVFQDAALFPWLTAQENVELPLKLQGITARERRHRAAAMLARVHLGAAAARRPHELSGGMRQRVALARALVQDPQVLLMDEPFGALDAITRDSLHDELESITTGSELSTVFVTHDASEAVRLANRVLVMSPSPGRIASELRIDLPRPRPAGSPEVADAVAAILGRLRQESRHAA